MPQTTSLRSSGKSNCQNGTGLQAQNQYRYFNSGPGDHPDSDIEIEAVLVALDMADARVDTIDEDDSRVLGDDGEKYRTWAIRICLDRVSSK